MCHCETLVKGDNEIYPVEEKKTGHKNENTPCSSDFWRGVVCKPGAVKVEDLLVVLIQMESHGPTAPAHQTLKYNITKSHERERKSHLMMCLDGSI